MGVFWVMAYFPRRLFLSLSLTSRLNNSLKLFSSAFSNTAKPKGGTAMHIHLTRVHFFS